MTDRELAGIRAGPGEEPLTLSARALWRKSATPGCPARPSSASDPFQLADTPIHRDRSTRFSIRSSGTRITGMAPSFKDKVVIIGASAQVAHDFVATPMDADMPGPALHLASDGGRDRSRISALDVVARGLRARRAALDLLAWVLIAFVRRPLLHLLLLVGASVGLSRSRTIAYDRVRAAPV